VTDLLLRRVSRAALGLKGRTIMRSSVRMDVIGRIFEASTSPLGTPWMWSLAYRQHEDRRPTHGDEPTRDEAMQAFAKSWLHGM
jgi:hypothetical protein